MSEYNFSVANTTYLMTAINMINDDPVMAKIMLGLDDSMIDMLRDLTQEEIRVLCNSRMPLMDVSFDTNFIKHLQDACNPNHKTSIKRIENISKLNDRLLLKVS